jgi:hypothetical protein
MMTSVDANEVARNEAIDFARRLVQRWQETLGTDLLGAYLIGSLAHGGFNRRYSDRMHRLERRRCEVSERKTRAGA